MSLDPSSKGSLKWLTTDAARGETGPQYSPDGRRIAYWSTRNGAERESICVMDADGANPNRLVEDGRVNAFPRWTGDGQELVFVSRPPHLAPGNDLRRVEVSGGVPQVFPIEPWSPHSWGDVARDGRLIYRTSARDGEVYDPRSKSRQAVTNLLGDPSWSRDGRSFAYVVPPDAQNPSDVGLWTGTVDGTRRQIFRGWVVGFAWASSSEVLVLEGKADFQGVLWRVETDGGQQVLLSGVPLFRRHTSANTIVRFDVHPDGRRIVIEALEFFEADIGMIENVR
jgi:Tol biopolymer transport system component